MKEGTGKKRKGRRKRRELLIIVLFQLTSILICVISVIFKVGGTSAVEYIPVSIHAINAGDYSTDEAVFSFKQASLAICLSVLIALI